MNYSRRSLTQSRAKTRCRVARPLNPWIGRSLSSTRRWLRVRWPCWRNCFGTASSPIMGHSSTRSQARCAHCLSIPIYGRSCGGDQRRQVHLQLNSCDHCSRFYRILPRIPRGSGPLGVRRVCQGKYWGLLVWLLVNGSVSDSAIMRKSKSAKVGCKC